MKIKNFKTQPYQEVWQRMHDFTINRTKNHNDEIWIMDHLPVYTLGQTGKLEHIVSNYKQIPIIKTDRGGQVTYHGPGQIIFYVLLDLRRLEINIRNLIAILEQSVIDTLKYYCINARRKYRAPGVYVHGAKIASVGLRIYHGCSYHGMSVNFNMDLEPFNNINICGYKELQAIQFRDLKITDNQNVVSEKILELLMLYISTCTPYSFNM